MLLDPAQICVDTVEFDRARIVTFLNPYSYLKLSEAEMDLSRFDKIGIDGVALQIFFNLTQRDRRIERISFDFTSIAGQVFERSVNNGERGFILGSDEHSNREFIERISSMYHGIDIRGRAGFFSSNDEMTEFLESIASSDYDYIIIGMGAVRQEQAANILVDSGFQGRVYTCGGFIHQTALNGGEYYPAWIDRFNLRFAYRMFREPETIRRYLLDYPKAFALLARSIKTVKS